MQAHESRRAFLARVLSALVQGPMADDVRLCKALLAVEACQALHPQQVQHLGLLR